MGWHCSDTAHLRFDGVRVPVRYRLGEEGAGFRMIMGNFNGERLAMSAMALGFAQACYDEALDWARQRQTFGAALIERQTIRHKLMDMRMRIESTQAWVDAVTARADAGDQGADWVAMCACSRTTPPRPCSSAPTPRCRSSAAWATCAAPPANASTARSRS
jgi:acyl-CoA dehydrogenase